MRGLYETARRFTGRAEAGPTRAQWGQVRQRAKSHSGIAGELNEMLCTKVCKRGDSAWDVDASCSFREWIQILLTGRCDSDTDEEVKREVFVQVNKAPGPAVERLAARASELAPRG